MEKEFEARLFAIVMGLLLALGSITAAAQDIKFGKGAFDATFQIDSSVTRDGNTFEVSASGDAGPYGRAYISYVFTDKQGMDNVGEFTGFAWTQQGEDIVTATLQGVYKKSGKVYRLYSFDAVSNRKVNIVSGVADFVERTMKFKVSELEIP